MENAATLHERVAERNANSASCAQLIWHEAQQFVSEDRDSMSDEEREAAIKWAGNALIYAYSRKEAARRRYEASSCLTDKADMDAEDLRARSSLRLMEALIRGRSQAQIDRMQKERGLA